MWNYTKAVEVSIAGVDATKDNFGNVRKVYAEGPNWTHDCHGGCEYLGYMIRHDGYGEVLSPEYDVYLHGCQLIIRYSSEGPDYHCMRVELVSRMMEDKDASQMWRCAYNLYRSVKG